MSAVSGAAVIGLRMGARHAEAYLALGVKVIAVCDLDGGRLADARGRYGAEVATTDYRDALARDDVSVVSVASPDGFHVEHCVAAMQAGKDVLCEKPLALSVAECREIVRAADETGRVCMVGQVCRYAPGFVKAKGLVDAGALGEFFFVESEYAHNYEKARGVGDWRLDPKRHPVIGGGCHAVDLLRWVAGEIEEVFAYANHKALPEWPCDDCTVAVARFASGVVGKVFVGIGVRRPYTMRSVFYGREGTLICDNTSPEVLLARASRADALEWEHIPVDISSHNVQAEASEFLAAVRGEKPLVTDAREGARTVAACAAIVRSAKLGKPCSPERLPS
ncbi:MAG: Gfo/Idh/MocA family oxidoreductase [Planctomycetota bacterium]